MTERVTLLTTDTSHHRRFADVLAERGLVERSVEETTRLIIDRLRAHGISCAVVVEPRPVRSGDDPLRVSRYLVA